MRSSKFLSGMVFFCVLCTVISVNVAASDTSALWDRIYRDAATESQRYDVMLKMVDVNDPDISAVLQTALSSLYARRIENGSVADQRTKINLAELIISRLGTLTAPDSKVLLMRIYNEAKDPYLKGESAQALGKMGAAEYAEFFARDLADLNLKPDVGDTHSQEVKAAYLVAALAFLKAPVGLEPVFSASIGWYSPASKVKEQARTAFTVMSDNPIPFLQGVIEKPTTVTTKLRAIEAAANSAGAPALKASLARAALGQGLMIKGNDLLNSTDLAALRIKALRMLVAAADADATSVPLIGNSIKFLGASVEEVLLGYEALGKNTSSASVAFLVAQLTEYHRRQKEGVKNTDDERRFIRAIIADFALQKPSAAKAVLTEVQFSNHDAQITREAKDVADQLK